MGGFLEVAMSQRFERRLAIVRQKIEELERTAAEDTALVVSTDAQEQLRELYAEAEFLEAMAA